ncbi:MAG: 1-acyl-sn-glycerol-3-phosphate acyltransferase [Leptospiraceae bacterium]|nr:1-acyl-sn-glycerol-3-phosphate acyltransferase [Leptospiraceae bacterium]
MKIVVSLREPNLLSEYQLTFQNKFMGKVFMNLFLRTVSLARFLVFNKVYVYYNTQKKVEVVYPTIIMANHVNEFDIPSMTYISRFVLGDSRYTIPAREDILKKGFLVKEFEPKGFLKLVLRAIDASGIIPFLFRFVNAVGVKRPFRDNSRTLMKSGDFKNEIDKNWDILAAKVNEGNNLFLFPEGTYSYDGYPNPFRKGITLFMKKVPNVSFNFIALTYDSLTNNKTDSHITIGELVKPEFASDEEVLAFCRKRIGSMLVLTEGNLFSWTIFQDILIKGITSENLFNKIHYFLEKLKLLKTIHISTKLIEGKFSNNLFKFLERATKEKFLRKEDNQYFSEPKLHEKPFEKTYKFKKQNPYLYHKNQLNFHAQKMEETWNQL